MHTHIHNQPRGETSRLIYPKFADLHLRGSKTKEKFFEMQMASRRPHETITLISSFKYSTQGFPLE